MSWNPVVAAVVLKCLKLQQCICVDPSCRLSASCDDCCGGDHAWVQRNWTFTLHLPTSKCGNVCPSWSLGSTKKEVQYLTGCLLAYQKIYLTKSSFFHISLHILLSSCKMPPKNHYPNKTRNGSPVLKKKQVARRDLDHFHLAKEIQSNIPLTAFPREFSWWNPVCWRHILHGKSSKNGCKLEAGSWNFWWF